MAKKRTKADKVARKVSKREKQPLWVSDLFARLSDIPSAFKLKGHLEVTAAALRKVMYENEELRRVLLDAEEEPSYMPPPDFVMNCDHEGGCPVDDEDGYEVWSCCGKDVE